MNIRFFVILAALSLAVAGCKKDNLDDVKLMMTGDPVISIDDYVLVGSSWSLEAGGITVPEERVGYYWNIEGVVDDNDTTDVFNFAFNENYGTYRIRCVAFSDEYYDRSTNKYVVTVDTAFNRSLNIGEVPGTGIFTDDRDGREYRYVTIGGLDWFISNLAYNKVGIPYMDSDVMWSVFGGYYTFEEAVSGYNGGQICPDGWRLPSENDWADLAASLAVRLESVDSGETYPGIVSAMMADVFFNDEKMWSYDPQSAPSNTSGFSAIPAGYYSQGQFSGLNVYSMFWSSDVYEGAASEGGVYHYIYYKNADLKMNYADTAFRASVRCVRDSSGI